MTKMEADFSVIENNFSGTRNNFSGTNIILVGLKLFC